MVTTKQLKELLDKEIDERKDLESRFKKLLKDYNFFRKDSKNNLEIRKEHIEDYKKEFDIKIEKVERIRDHILEHALQIVAIIVAILALVMTFSFLSTDYYNAPEEFIWLVAIAIIYFSVIFTLWANAWRKRNRYDANLERGREITSQTENKKSRLLLAVGIGGLVGYIGSFASGYWLRFEETGQGLGMAIFSNIAFWSVVVFLTIMIHKILKGERK